MQNGRSQRSTVWRNPVKEKLVRGEPVFGTVITVNSVQVAAQTAALGFDFLWLEMEHALIKLEQIRRYRIPLCVLLAFCIAAAAGVVFAEPAPVSASGNSFSNPPAEARIIKIIHGWPDEPAAQDSLIKRLTAQGFGGVVCNVSFKDYLVDEERWKAFVRAIEEAKKAGFSLWLYDERGYPSGTAGGTVLRDHPEWEARGLLIADAEGGNGTLNLDMPPGEPFLVAAFPLRNGDIKLSGMTNLASQVREGKLTWTAPAGRWHAMAITESPLFEGTHASVSLSYHIPYPNLLEPQPTARFLEVTHQCYAKYLGDDLGRWFVSTFTDEPSLMSLFLRPMPYRVLPWSPNLPEEFKKRRGYALEPMVPALVADAGSEGQRVRYDYWHTVGELVSKNYFGQIQQWCGKHDLLSGGHLLMEENLVLHVPLYGDFFSCLRQLSAPSIDCLTSIPGQVPWHIARLASSAAELEGRSVTMCETSDHGQRYRPPGDKRPVQVVSEDEIRGTCNRLIVEGIDTITSYYSFGGLSDEQLRRLNDWVGRCCAAVKGGHQVANVAVVYPIESVWPKFKPGRHYARDAIAAARVEHVFEDVSQALFSAGRDFTYVDSRALLEAKVEKATLVHNDLRWDVVVLPDADTLPLAAWEKLARFAEGGGVVVAVGALPANSEKDFPSPPVLELGRKIFGASTNSLHVAANNRGGGGVVLPAGAAGLPPRVLDGIVEPDVQVAGSRAPLRSTHRRIAGREVYFVINDSAEPWSGTITFAADGPAEMCDPATGEVHAFTPGSELHLSGYRGAVFRFAKALPPARFQLSDRALPRLELRSLPEVAPTIARGEFVREELAAAAPDRQSRESGWRVTGKIVKSEVDTFLFAQFSYPQPLDLRGTDFLLLEVSVPPGQKTPNQLLAILHEKGGADYLASTGCSLGLPGQNRIWLPLSLFQLAGWSHDANGHLDQDSITEFRVGWGGYHGTEGEKVEFTLKPPTCAEAR